MGGEIIPIGGAVLNIAVVDDIMEDRAQLINNIERYMKENSVLVQYTEFESGEAFLERMHLNVLDAVFLDIYMPGLNGMEIAHKIHEIKPSCMIVFVTTTAAFAVESYEVNALYYLLKPFNYQSICDVMQQIDKKTKKSSKYITVKEGREWIKIFLCDIIYADISNHYVQIHTTTSIVSTYIKFHEIEEKLVQHNEFMKCYRCIVVNMNKIEKIKDLFFLMCNGEYIPINRKQVKEIKLQYTEFIFGTLEEEEFS